LPPVNATAAPVRPDREKRDDCDKPYERDCYGIHDASPQASACAPQNTTGNAIYDNKKTRRMRAAGLLGKCAGVCSSGN
jgi:hypothetical protein